MNSLYVILYHQYARERDEERGPLDPGDCLPLFATTSYEEAKAQLDAAIEDEMSLYAPGFHCWRGGNCCQLAGVSATTGKSLESTLKVSSLPHHRYRVTVGGAA